MVLFDSGELTQSYPHGGKHSVTEPRFRPVFLLPLLVSSLQFCCPSFPVTWNFWCVPHLSTSNSMQYLRTTQFRYSISLLFYLLGMVSRLYWSIKTTSTFHSVSWNRNWYSVQQSSNEHVSYELGYTGFVAFEHHFSHVERWMEPGGVAHTCNPSH